MHTDTIAALQTTCERLIATNRPGNSTAMAMAMSMPLRVHPHGLWRSGELLAETVGPSQIGKLPGESLGAMLAGRRREETVGFMLEGERIGMGWDGTDR
jgi:hypothetical protein